MILWEVKHRYVSFSFTFSQGSAMCFNGSLIALKFTAFKAQAQLIIWLTETPPVNYSSSENWTFCWPTDDTAYYMQQEQKRRHLLYCSVLWYHSLIFLFPFSLFFFLSMTMTLPLPSLLFPSLWWCIVSLSPCTLSHRCTVSNAVIDFLHQGQHQGNTLAM